MKKLILLAFFGTYLYWTFPAYASAQPADAAVDIEVDAKKEGQPQVMTIANHPNDAKAPGTIIITDSEKMEHVYAPGSSGGLDPSKCPCTIEVKQ